MRRPFLNSISIVYICLIAIFTLASYVFDQGVIRQEDSIRKSEIKIDNLTSKKYDVYTISKELNSISDYLTSNLINISRNKDYWIKALLTLDKNSNLKDANMINSISDYDYTIDKIKKELIYHFNNILVISYDIEEKYSYVHRWNSNYFKEYHDEEGYYKGNKLNLDFQKTINENSINIINSDFNFYYPPSLKNIKNYNTSNFLDIHKISFYLLKNMASYYDHIHKDILKIDKLDTDFGEQLENELIRNKDISSIKNYFILASIASQILSLLFLLLFFRNFLINKL